MFYLIEHYWCLVPLQHGDKIQVDHSESSIFVAFLKWNGRCIVSMLIRSPCFSFQARRPQDKLSYQLKINAYILLLFLQLFAADSIETS